MRIFLQANPMVRYVLPLIVGILFARFLSAFLLLEWLVVAEIMLLIGVLFFYFYRKKVLLGICTFIFCTFLGIFLVMNKVEAEKPPNELKSHYAQAIVRSVGDEKSKTVVYLCEIKNIKINSTWLPTSFRTLIYISKDSKAMSLQYGDTISGNFSFQELKHSTNPYTFDFARLMENRQTYVSAYLKSEEIICTPFAGFSLKREAVKVQEQLGKVLQKYIDNTEILGFLQAMTLGDKTMLSPTVKIDFADTGVIHILAVSGLHVGILFLLFNLLMRPFQNTEVGRGITSVLGILFIWSFAFISGLSISVIRAATMFSIFHLGGFTLRPYRIYNTLALSAFILLLINPFYLFEVGFQLSYFAVMGIVVFVPMWQGKKLKYKVLEYLKQVILVSLAAQLGVFPIILYYFHNIPTYFLLANLVIIPLAPFLFGGTMLLLATSSMPLIANIIAFLLNYLTIFGLKTINLIAQLPMNILVHTRLSVFQLLLLYGMIISYTIYHKNRKIYHFYAIMTFVILLFSIGFYHNIEHKNQQKFIVHNAVGEKVYSLIDGRDALVLGDTIFSERTKEYVLRPLWEAMEVGKPQFYEIEEENMMSLNRIRLYGNHCFFKGKHIVFALNSNLRPTIPVKVDYLILSSDSYHNEFLQSFYPQIIIADSSMKPWQIKKLKKVVLNTDIELYVVSEQGAYVLD